MIQDVIAEIKSKLLTNSNKIIRKNLHQKIDKELASKIEDLFEIDEEIQLIDKINCLLQTGNTICIICSSPLTKKLDFRKFICYDCRKKEKNEKRKITTIKRYGVEHISQLNSTKKKYKETCIKKYGVEHSFKNNEIKQKRLNTLNKNHNVSNPFQSEKVKEKIKKTNIEKYGVENVSSSFEVKEKRKQTFIQKYGVDHPNKNFNVIQKSIKTRMENYWNLFLEEQKNSIKSLKEIYDKEHVEEGHTISYICKKYNLPFNYVKSQLIDLNLPIIRRYYVSNGELIIKQFIESFYDGKIISHDRKLLGGQKEIDLYIPEFNLGIEYHGSFWHSNIEESKHQNKYLLAKKANIELIQLFDWELEEKEDIVFSLIKSRFGFYDHKINARDCLVKEISLKEYKLFCEENHMQGYAPSRIKLGLFHKDELVSIMSFSRPRSKSNHDYEMIRFCNKKYSSIRGGASKLFSYFTKNFNFSSIISFSDNRLFNGKLYEKLGFNYSHDSSPNYWYIKGQDKLSRISAQKHKLKNLLKEGFNPELSEKENMLSNGYRIIFDAGNKVFVYYK